MREGAPLQDPSSAALRGAGGTSGLSHGWGAALSSQHPQTLASGWGDRVVSVGSDKDTHTCFKAL